MYSKKAHWWNEIIPVYFSCNSHYGSHSDFFYQIINVISFLSDFFVNHINQEDEKH
jgi:hypothetical protein